MREIVKSARYVDLRETQIEGDDVLVIGGGGREHAICWALRRSNKVGHIYCAPGNAGMCVNQVDISATDIEAIIAYVDSHPNIKLTVVAPDDPLGMGLVDELTKRGHRAFGPVKAAAKLEWSKAYAKDFMKKYAIPTASYGIFKTADSAKQYIEKTPAPMVVKADGLALGKGVIICQTKDEAIAAVDEIMLDKKFGDAGNEVVIEQFLTGYEVSLLAFCDGDHYALMPTSCDHKRALDGDKGLNTGGMGAYSPCPAFGRDMIAKAERQIVRPTLDGMKKEGAPFKGVLYFGLMVDGDKIYVLEYNARFGDPETQCILPLLKSDLYDIMNSTVDGTLDTIDVQWSDFKSINVVLASGGYPEKYKKGCPISGLGDTSDDVNIFFAGVKQGENGLVSSGGRVLCVQAVAPDFAAAKQLVYDNIAKIKFENCYYRKDIGIKL